MTCWISLCSAWLIDTAVPPRGGDTRPNRGFERGCRPNGRLSRLRGSTAHNVWGDHHGTKVGSCCHSNAGRGDVLVFRRSDRRRGLHNIRSQRGRGDAVRVASRPGRLGHLERSEHELPRPVGPRAICRRYVPAATPGDVVDLFVLLLQLSLKTGTDAAGISRRFLAKVCGQSWMTSFTALPDRRFAIR